jgi:ferrochelatase
VTSAYSSYSSCRQYLQNISDAQAAVGPQAPRVEKLRAFYNHPLFIEANVDHIRTPLKQVGGDAQLVFTAHSIPESMAANCDYAMQLAETGGLIARELGIANWQLRLSESQRVADAAVAGTGCLRSFEDTGG